MMITGRTLVSTGILVSGWISLTLYAVLHTDRSLIRLLAVHWMKKGTSQMQMPLGMAKLRDYKQQVLANNPSIHNHRIDDRQPFCPVSACTHLHDGEEPSWHRRKSEAVRQQNCDVANRRNRADRSWHRRRE
jgi:hypothetical protein